MKLKSLSDTTFLFSLRSFFCCEWSDDDKVYIINADGIDVHHLTPNPTGLQKLLIFDRHFIYPITENPTESVAFNDEFMGCLPREELFRALSNPLVTPKCSFGNSSYPGSYLTACWSPADVLPSKSCLLAALNCLGSVTIWCYQRTWSVILDVSHYIYLHIKENKDMPPSTCQTYSKTMDNIVNNCNKLACSAIAWSDSTYQAENMTYAHFVTAQKNGDIYIFTVVATLVDNQVTLNTSISLIHPTQHGEINQLHWISYSDNTYLLIVGYAKGILHCLSLQNKNYALDVVKTSVVWSEEDDISASKIISTRWDRKHYFVAFVKERFLISLLIDENGDVAHCQHDKFGDLKITGLQRVNSGELYLCTLYGTLIRVQVHSDNNLPKLNACIVETELNCDKYVQHGLCISKNKAFWLHLMNPRKRVRKFHGKKWSKCFVSYKQDYNPMDVLINNNSQVLTDHWDVLELVRLLKTHNLMKNPLQNNGLVQADCETLLYKLKLSLWINVMWQNESDNESTIKELKRLILGCHATENLKRLAALYKESESLTDCQSETVSLQCKLYSGECPQDVLSLLSMENLPDDIRRCEWCDEELVYPICSNSHQREFCCVTYRDVDSRMCLVCSLCDAVGHIDLWSDNPLCTFCDSRLRFSPVCSQISIKENECNSEEISTVDNLE